MSTKHYNLRLTASHNKTRTDIHEIKKDFNVLAYAVEDIAWQNSKPEKPHMHIIIETTCCFKTIKNKINGLGYKGNSGENSYKIGRPINDLQESFKYICKGISLGKFHNVVTQHLEIDEIEKFNKSFWEKKNENDKTFVEKKNSLSFSILKNLMDVKKVSDDNGRLNLRKVIEIILDEYRYRKIGHSRHIVEKYINLAVNLYDKESEIQNLEDQYRKWNQFPTPKITSSIYEIKNPNLEKYGFKEKENENENENENEKSEDEEDWLENTK